MTTQDFTIVQRTDHLLDLLLEELDTARAKCAGDSRWLNALNAAQDWFHWSSAFEWDAAHSALRVASASEVGAVYVANGSCQCAAYTKSAEHQACWHRAAARVLRNALARLQEPRPLPFEPKRPMTRAERAEALRDMAELFA